MDCAKNLQMILNLSNILKLILAILLLLCLLDFPYGYYQLVRFVATMVFGYLAYNAQQENKKNEVFVYIALAVLFQPFIKIALGRMLWNIVDVIVALGLIFNVITQKNNQNKNEL